MGKKAARNLITRKCTEADLAFVHDLTLGNMKRYVDRYWGGWEEELFWADIDKDSITLLEQGGQSVGFFDIREKEPGVLQLINIQVEARMQGRGIGTYILRLVETLAAEQGLGKIRLKVFTDNPAVEFYRRSGFFVVETRSDCLSMEKSLGQWEVKSNS